MIQSMLCKVISRRKIKSMIRFTFIRKSFHISHGPALTPGLPPAHDSITKVSNKTQPIFFNKSQPIFFNKTPIFCNKIQQVRRCHCGADNRQAEQAVVGVEVCSTSHVTHHSSHVTSYTSHVTHHTPRITHHTSRVNPMCAGSWGRRRRRL